jgi:hypothetical protein
MLKKFTVMPGPQIYDSWANSPMGRVRFQTANREGSSCRLRYRYARILMRRRRRSTATRRNLVRSYRPEEQIAGGTR